MAADDGRLSGADIFVFLKAEVSLASIVKLRRNSVSSSGRTESTTTTSSIGQVSTVMTSEQPITEQTLTTIGTVQKLCVYVCVYVCVKYVLKFVNRTSQFEC
jgi:hypothetical protein